MSGGREIERKFLVVGDGWRKSAGKPSHIIQGYLARGRKAIVRIRIRDGKQATLTIKSREPGASRSEFEYRIALNHAREMLELCGKARLEKLRYNVQRGRTRWEIDVFSSPHEGLVIAEVELDDAGDVLKLPAWVGDEVTADPRYRNSSLVDGGRFRAGADGSPGLDRRPERHKV